MRVHKRKAILQQKFHERWKIIFETPFSALLIKKSQFQLNFEYKHCPIQANLLSLIRPPSVHTYICIYVANVEHISNTMKKTNTKSLTDE